MSIKGTPQYIYIKQGTETRVNITKYVSTHASGSERINELPGNFSFTISPPRDNSDPDYPDINTGDIIIISRDDTFTEAIAIGAVIDPGRDMAKYSIKDSRAYFKFNIKCVQEDFGITILEKLSFTDTLVSEILAELFSYSDDSLGSETRDKFISNITDFTTSWTFEIGPLRLALTEFCDHIQAFWIKKYDLDPDETNLVDYTSWIEINSRDGTAPSSDSSWLNGYVDENLRTGLTDNPIVSNRSTLAKVPAETDKPQISEDRSVICNQVVVSCNIFVNGDNTTLDRWEKPAEPKTFDYDLKQIAYDINYVGVTDLEPTRILSGSTAGVIRVPSRAAVTISADDIVIFPDRSKVTVYRIETVTKINNTYTEIAFYTDLPFSPSENERVELLELSTIYEEHQLSYASQGVVKDCDKSRPAKIRFLDLSEPPPGTRIIVLYIKVQPYKMESLNSESIETPGIGLRYREIKVPDDVVLTVTEADNLSSLMLILKPKIDMTIPSVRYESPPIGLSLTVKLNSWLTENMILIEKDWQILGGRDRQKQPIIRSNLTFSNMIKTQDQLLEGYLQTRKATTTSQKDSKYKQQETISISENIYAAFTDSVPAAPEALAATDPTSEGFTANWTAVSGAEYYKLYVQATSGGAIYQYMHITETYQVVGGKNSDTEYKYWVTAVNSIGESEESNEITVTTASDAIEEIVFSSDRSGKYNIYIAPADSTNLTNTYATRLTTTTTHNDYHPLFSNDKRYILFTRLNSSDVGQSYIYDRLTNTVTNLSNDSTNVRYVVWSADNSKIIEMRQITSSSYEIWTRNPDGSSPTKILNTNRFFPEGLSDNRVAFTHFQSSSYGVRVANLDGTGETTVIATSGASKQVRATDNIGTNIYYNFATGGAEQAFKVSASGGGATQMTNSTNNNPATNCYPISTSPDDSKLLINKIISGKWQIMEMDNTAGASMLNLSQNTAYNDYLADWR